MNIIWLGHSGFRIEIEEAVLIVDPWLEGNPMFPADRRNEAIKGATHVILTHAHEDHGGGDALAICKELNIPLVGIFDLTAYHEETNGLNTIGFNKGGSVDLNGAKLTMVNACHSSSFTKSGHPVYGGAEVGYMLEGEGETIYISGDTDIMADMEWMADFHKPTIGILCAGGHFTMDMARAAYAVRRYFRFHTVIPCHYRTFPLLEQNAEVLKAGVPVGVNVIEPRVMTAISF